MKKKIFIIAGIVLLNCIAVKAQEMLTPVQYIALYKDIAISEMKRMGVPAAITLAQGLLETESGNSKLVKKSNNHFGIKCKNNWTGGSVSHDDDAIGECFRVYKNAEESYRDHSNFLRAGSRYGFLFDLDVRDYKGWAQGLKKAGYATNPSYPAILIKHIEQYNLQQYTLQAADEAPKFDAEKYKDDVEEKPVVEEKVTDDVTMLDVSDKVITINGTKAVLAGKGTSLLVVATKNNVNLNKILGFNELAEDGMLVKNQYVFLEKKSKTGDKDFYIATAGESLYDIAQENGIQLQYMLDYNKMRGNEVIVAGTKIYLKPGIMPATVMPPASAGNPVKAVVKIHTVAAKEGLYAIAKKYNVSVQQLREWNKLQNDSLSIGQQLIISE